MHPEALLTRSSLQRHLAVRAAEDPSFRRDLLADPRAAIERELQLLLGPGARLPAGIVIHLHEETSDTVHLVLPARDGAVPDPDRDRLTVLWQGSLTPRE
jgi:hypothetical protein